MTGAARGRPTAAIVAIAMIIAIWPGTAGVAGEAVPVHRAPGENRPGVPGPRENPGFWLVHNQERRNVSIAPLPFTGLFRSPSGGATTLNCAVHRLARALRS